MTEEKGICEQSKKISAFGDSVLRGVILDGDKYRVSKNSFANICEEVLGVRIENKAKFGSTVATGEKSLMRSLDTIKSSNGEYVVLEFGGNDCDYNWKEISEDPSGEHKPNSEISDFVKIYTELINLVKELGKKPVLLSLPPVDFNRYFRTISKGLNAENILKWMNGNKQFITNWHERYNIEVFKLAINNHIPIIDITSRFLEEKQYERLLCEDGIHPNEEGHRLIAEAIREHVVQRKIEF